MATDTMSLVEKCQELAREHGGKVSTALATLMLACQMNVANAQTAPVNPADSANAAAAKGLEYGQYAKDGREFSKLTPEEVKGLSDDDYDAYNYWNIAKKSAKINQINLSIAEKDANINQINLSIAEKDATINQKLSQEKQVDVKLITEYKDYIRVFRELDLYKGKPGFDAVTYMKMKNELRGVLISGKPPEIIPQLESLRSILMSP